MNLYTKKKSIVDTIINIEFHNYKIGNEICKIHGISFHKAISFWFIFHEK